MSPVPFKTAMTGVLMRVLTPVICGCLLGCLRETTGLNGLTEDRLTVWFETVETCVQAKITGFGEIQSLEKILEFWKAKGVISKAELDVLRTDGWDNDFVYRSSKIEDQLTI